MRFSASSMGFPGPEINNMALLPKDFGIEIFYEWGSADYWNDALDLIMRERTGGFSIHSPFNNVDICMPCDEEKLFHVLRTPFDLYHKYSGEFYVVHTNGYLPADADKQFEDDCRKRAEDRLARFHEICVSEGVRMVVENLGFRRGKKHLYNHQQFLELFQALPEIWCLIDTGHTLLGDFDIYDIQKTLKNRLVAYHVHDNDKMLDQHLRIGAGCLDWNRFAQGYKEFTPDAAIVMEYNLAAIKEYQEDKDRLLALLSQTGSAQYGNNA